MRPAQIYNLQVWLRCVKPCRSCGKVKLVPEFGGYGVQICNACDAVQSVEHPATDELEQYFAELKQRVGVGAA